MKKLTILLWAFAWILIPIPMYSYDHPEANFGIYGIQHLPTIADYQQYVGQTVRYMKAGMKDTGNYYDEKEFLNKGGRFDIEYTIVKISGNDKRMTFLLQEKGGKAKYKMIVNNSDTYYSYGKYTFCITDTYTIPLLLIDKLNADKNKYVGKVYPDNPECPVQIEIKDIIMQEQKWSVGDSHKCYPIPVF